MKHFILVMASLFLLVNLGFSQQTDEQKKEQIREIMQDTTMRSMMMEQMVQDPEMRSELRQHMIRTARGDSMMMRRNMQQMMQDPETKKRMQEHISYMQSMMEGRQMDKNRMRQMDESGMMRMNAVCLEMMKNGIQKKSRDRRNMEKYNDQ
jgi:hypothetical protein